MTLPSRPAVSIITQAFLAQQNHTLDNDSTAGIDAREKGGDAEGKGVEQT